MKFHAARVVEGVLQSNMVKHTLELLAKADRQGRTCIGMVPKDNELILFFSSKDNDEPGSEKPVDSCCNSMASAVEAGLLHASGPSDPSRVISMSRELSGKYLHTTIKFCPWCSTEIR